MKNKRKLPSTTAIIKEYVLSYRKHWWELWNPKGGD